MKIAFVDFANWNYSVTTVNEQPLGGSQSALCYLAVKLAECNHTTFLINNISSPLVINGVACLPIETVSSTFWKMLDFIIVLNSLHNAHYFRKLCHEKTQLILWSQHDSNQPAVHGFSNPDIANCYDYIVLISEWQKSRYIQEFGLDPRKIIVMNNAVGNDFINLFPDNQSIFKEKDPSPILAYTSTPFRGLELLVDIFPLIQEKCPNVELKIFSSLKVYQVPDHEDMARFGRLYGHLSSMPGVTYIGSVPQSELAQQLKKVSVLAYPNTFPETSCIAVMEAMASGCTIVTSNLGALPETTAGFGHLISFDNGLEDYKQKFVDTTIKILAEITSEISYNLNIKVKEQVQYCHDFYNWDYRAKEWLNFLFYAIAYQYFKNADYRQASLFFEEAINKSLTVTKNYFYLIICLILIDDSEKAFSIILYMITQGLLIDIKEFTNLIEKEIINFIHANNHEAIYKLNYFLDHLEWVHLTFVVSRLAPHL